MREIKFRAWLEDEDAGFRMVGVNKITFMDGFSYVYSPDDDYDYQIDNKYLMQFTGLHDKNGKEIYEGDILTDSNRKYICSWRNEEYAFVIYGEDKYKNTGYRAGSAKWVQKHFEVIGNIYENPELLEVKDAEG